MGSFPVLRNERGIRYPQSFVTPLHSSLQSRVVTVARYINVTKIVTIVTIRSLVKENSLVGNEGRRERGRGTDFTVQPPGSIHRKYMVDTRLR